MKKRLPKVVVLGGGVAGMSAAHELAERGFEVSVYEARTTPGGKARSMDVKGSGIDGRKDLPGEHGFRFFPKFYKHVTDTMKRIPYGDNRHGVFDNLIEGTRLGLAFNDRAMLPFITEFPESIRDLKVLYQSLFENHLGLTAEEAAHYGGKLYELASSCELRRYLDYQRISWWDFIEADKQSEQFKRIFVGLSRILVAAKAQEANACTIGTVGAELMLDMVTPGGSADRLLNGPTNEVWIYPWYDYLNSIGVQFNRDAPVKAIHCDNGAITGITVVMDGQEQLVTGDCFISALPVEVMAGLVNEELISADPLLGKLKTLAESVEWMNGIQFYLNEELPLIHGHIICMDSPWALTLVSQKQFWPNTDLAEYGNGNVKGVLSVDVSDWEAPGPLFGKPAMKCSAEEIRQEVWQQLKDHFNHGSDVLHDGLLEHWFLDEDIQFPNPHEATNMEPLLVNRVHTWDLRPNAYTAIPNLYLASDYVRTNTDLATMEGANEAARRAVNAIIDYYEIKADKCRIWEMYEFELLGLWQRNDKSRWQEGLPWNGKIVG
ncbi:FAD-dependent oxidoreductase [Paenibacillus pasadenensis]|uniref:hydroxysqualene dehydroxylase n=1 Tax=Paenibacillus pasadenensis TaxID=217090 RepID=UPI00203EBDA5|nr:FAD-dependent oxidoreductase [Paenibacillus pasadenensis]MCM3750008.1 FAD-dependent oxidoreductase [Paenibacillus pasadenensis]